MEKLFNRIFKDGKLTSILGLVLSGAVHNLFPGLPVEIYAAVDAIAGGLIVSKDPTEVIPPAAK